LKFIPHIAIKIGELLVLATTFKIRHSKNHQTAARRCDLKYLALSSTKSRSLRGWVIYGVILIG